MKVHSPIPPAFGSCHRFPCCYLLHSQGTGFALLQIVFSLVSRSSVVAWASECIARQGRGGFYVVETVTSPVAGWRGVAIRTPLLVIRTVGARCPV
jgi:hypothetical protein